MGSDKERCIRARGGESIWGCATNDLCSVFWEKRDIPGPPRCRKLPMSIDNCQSLSRKTEAGLLNEESALDYGPPHMQGNTTKVIETSFSPAKVVFCETAAYTCSIASRASALLCLCASTRTLANFAALVWFSFVLELKPLKLSTDGAVKKFCRASEYWEGRAKDEEEEKRLVAEGEQVSAALQARNC